jgi:hypothetical protein
LGRAGLVLSQGGRRNDRSRCKNGDDQRFHRLISRIRFCFRGSSGGASHLGSREDQSISVERCLRFVPQ